MSKGPLEHTALHILRKGLAIQFRLVAELLRPAVILRGPVPFDRRGSVCFPTLAVGDVGGNSSKLDKSIELSEPMRAGMVELSGLTRQEALVIKACATDIKSFKSVVATLIENYSGIHLREGRALGGGTPNNGGWTLGADARVPKGLAVGHTLPSMRRKKNMRRRTKGWKRSGRYVRYVPSNGFGPV